MPDDCVLGVGRVDLHVFPHQNFEINGVSDEDMDQLRLRDGQYLYYNKKKMWEYFKDRRDARSANKDSYDGAFLYKGKHKKDIDRKIGGVENTISGQFFQKIEDGKRTLAIAKNNIQKLLGMNTAFDMDSDINAVVSSIEKLQATIEKVENNATDNFKNPFVDGGHYWRSGQGNIQKYMKPRDSRLPNRQGSTSAFHDVQGGGIWGHDSNHRNPSRTSAPYR